MFQKALIQDITVLGHMQRGKYCILQKHCSEEVVPSIYRAFPDQQILDAWDHMTKLNSHKQTQIPFQNQRL